MDKSPVIDFLLFVHRIQRQGQRHLCIPGRTGVDAHRACLRFHLYAALKLTLHNNNRNQKSGQCQLADCREDVCSHISTKVPRTAVSRANPKEPIPRHTPK